MNISSARVFVKDLAKAEDFYSKKLGLHRVARDSKFG